MSAISYKRRVGICIQVYIKWKMGRHVFGIEHARRPDRLKSQTYYYIPKLSHCFSRVCVCLCLPHPMCAADLYSIQFDTHILYAYIRQTHVFKCIQTQTNVLQTHVFRTHSRSQHIGVILAAVSADHPNAHMRRQSVCALPTATKHTHAPSRVTLTNTYTVSRSNIYYSIHTHPCTRTFAYMACTRSLCVCFVIFKFMENERIDMRRQYVYGPLSDGSGRPSEKATHARRPQETKRQRSTAEEVANVMRICDNTDRRRRSSILTWIIILYAINFACGLLAHEPNGWVWHICTRNYDEIHDCVGSCVCVCVGGVDGHGTILHCGGWNWRYIIVSAVLCAEICAVMMARIPNARVKYADSTGPCINKVDTYFCRCTTVNCRTRMRTHNRRTTPSTTIVHVGFSVSNVRFLWHNAYRVRVYLLSSLSPIVLRKESHNTSPLLTREQHNSTRGTKHNSIHLSPIATCVDVCIVRTYTNTRTYGTTNNKCVFAFVRIFECVCVCLRALPAILHKTFSLSRIRSRTFLYRVYIVIPCLDNTYTTRTHSSSHSTHTHTHICVNNY